MRKLLLGLLLFSSPCWAITPPTLISYAETASWTTAGSPKTVTAVAWNSGDVIVVLSGSQDIDTLGTPTNANLTFTSQKSNSTAGTCSSRVSTAVAGSTQSGQTISATNSSATDHWGFGVWVYRGSDGVGNSAEQHTATKTVGLTPVQADSAIVWGTFDFGATAITGISITPAPTNTRQKAADGTAYTIYVADLADQTSTGSTPYGISGGSGLGPFSIVAVEIKGTAGGATCINSISLLGAGCK